MGLGVYAAHVKVTRHIIVHEYACVDIAIQMYAHPTS